MVFSSGPPQKGLAGKVSPEDVSVEDNRDCARNCARDGLDSAT